MNDVIITSKKWLTGIYTVWGLIIISAIIFFSRRYSDWRKEMEVFKKIEIHSRIIDIKNLNRGSYMVKVKIDGVYKSFSLQIGHDVDNYKIQVGDSLSKDNNSSFFEIFDTTETVPNKKCRIEVY